MAQKIDFVCRNKGTLYGQSVYQGKDGLGY